MKERAISAKALWIGLAVLCAAGTWLYAYRVLIPAQAAYAAEHKLPHGNHSDLYPRWVGARELLLHGRDPYTMEVTREIQIGFYGRVLPPDQPGVAENYQQGFYYPVYIAFFLAPTLDLPFKTVQHGFFWVLLAITVLTIPLWLRLVRWRVPLWKQAVVVVLTIGSLPLMQGLKLEQMTLVVAPLLAGAMVLLAADHPIPSGILLALATIKPQLVWLVLLWLTIWTLGDWRRRYRWAASFLVSMAILCVASEYYLPHWILRFGQALREYRSYTGEMSATAMLIGPWSRALELLAVAFMTALCWRERRQAADSEGFAVTVSLVLAITILVVPSYGPYNQALLLPALLIMLKERGEIWRKDAVNRILLVITIVLIGWPWLSSIVLAGLSFVLPPETVERGSLIPVWTALGIPIGVGAAMAVYAGQRTFAASQKPST
ncbi:MAG: glycosyltransferase family 87 protein, partial [Terriglobales bacterium]